MRYYKRVKFPFYIESSYQLVGAAFFFAKTEAKKKFVKFPFISKIIESEKEAVRCCKK